MAEPIPAQSKRRRLLAAASMEESGAGRAQPSLGTQPLAPAPARANDDDDDMDDIPLPSDVEASFLFLRNEMQNAQSALQLKEAKRGRSGGSLPPVVLVTQIMSVLKDKRNVEAELDVLRRKNTVRLFKLPTGVDEHGVMLTSDFVRAVRGAADETTRQGQELRTTQAPEEWGNPGSGAEHEVPASGPSVHQAVADLFCTRVVPNHTEVTISQSHLLGLIRADDSKAVSAQDSGHPQGRPSSAPYNHAMYENSIPTAAGHVAPDTVLATLLQLGVLSRHPSDDASYVLGCPALGRLVKNVLAGRKELLGIISKKPQGEMSERALLGNTLTGPRSTTEQQQARCRSGSFEGGFLRPLVIEVALSTDSAGDASGPAKGRGGKSRASKTASTALPGDTRGPGSGTAGVKMRQSDLSVHYHLRDLIGHGDLVRVQTTSGDLIRVVKRL